MDFRNGRSSDVNFKCVYKRTLVAIIVCAVFFGFGVLIAASENTRDSDIKFNEYVTEYNALPEDTRVAAAPFIKYAVPEGQTTLNYTEVDEPFGVQLAGAMPFVTMLFLLITSLTTFFSYWYEKRDDYFLADLPLRKPYGWFLLVSIAAGLPFLAVSAVRMIRYKYRKETKPEKEAIAKQLTSGDVTYEKPDSKVVQVRMRKARNKYVNYRINGRQKAIQHQCEELERRETEQRTELAELGKKIQRQQLLIGETAAEKKRLSGAKVTEKETREKALAEWETIMQMRGVSFVSVRQPKGTGIQPLTIDVKVRVPYKKNLYDFGDYRVQIDASGFTCKRFRSGIKTNASNNSPNYNESSGFCFGSRRYAIEDYIINGRLLEAITLIIDSLHEVNDEYAESQIPNCFRRVVEVKRVERWLKIKKVLGVQV